MTTPEELAGDIVPLVRPNPDHRNQVPRRILADCFGFPTEASGHRRRDPVGPLREAGNARNGTLTRRLK